MTLAPMNAEYVQKWFPLEQQRNYVSMLVKRGGMNRRRAEYFVRLWAYLLLKQQKEMGKRLVQPLTKLELPQGWVSCTHREAAELFYGDKERGGDRAAGMMIDQLAALGLIQKQFDGHSTCIQIIPWPELTDPQKPVETLQIKTDDFNPRTDTVPVTNLIAQYHSQTAKEFPATPHKTAKVLRTWAQQYPKGMRVLRRCDNFNPVGIFIVYPTSSESEANFFVPPAKTRFLTADVEVDPFKVATPGDPDCTCVYLRTWIIDNPYVQNATVCQFVEDLQKTLVQMLSDFPNLCDLYSVAMNPTYDELRRVLGFQKTYQDTQRSVHGIYVPVDRFLALDVKQALAGLNFQSACDL